ncbi:MAG: NAD(P)-dependent oxidoreductase [Thermoplasmata archaeon]|nr:NAD(P)-dependent oxidoreductase [Thermoplasmata archaeon]
MATVAVTGAAGFIGGALVPYLAARGHRLILVDDLSGPIHVLHPEHPVVREDLREAATLRTLEHAEVVLHLAAVSGVMACANEPEASRLVNVDATRQLVAWCRDRSIPMAFASSFAVVGIPEALPITERTPPRPTHEYARQKAEGEALLEQGTGSGGVRMAVLRMSNVYGRYAVGERVVAKGNVLNAFAKQAHEEGVLRVSAPGTQRRDYIHLLDVLAHWEAVARYLATPGRVPERVVFNVASGESATVLDLAQMVSVHWTRLHPGRPLEIRIVPNPRGSIELLQPEFEVDRSWTEQELGVRCERSLEASIDGLLGSRAETVG